VVYSNWYGKAATVIFYTIIFILILWQNISSAWTIGLLSVLVITMLGAAILYLVDIIKHYEIKRVD
jgi:surface polysaccharide O-acyltransferase-like enzyme